MTGVADAKSDGAVVAGQGADLKGLTRAHVVDEPNIAAHVVGIPAIPRDETGVVDAVRHAKEATLGGGGGDDSDRVAVVDHAVLGAPRPRRADGDAVGVDGTGTADGLTGGQGQLGDDAVLPDEGQRIGSPGGQAAGAHHRPGVVDAVAEAIGPAIQVGQSHEPAGFRPTEGLAGVAEGAAGGDAVGRDAEALREFIARIDETEVDDGVFRRCRQRRVRGGGDGGNEGGNEGGSGQSQVTHSCSPLRAVGTGLATKGARGTQCLGGKYS